MDAKEKHKFDVALINSHIVYWYIDDLENDGYNKRIEECLNWKTSNKELKKQVKYVLEVKKYIEKYGMSEEELRMYCFKLKRDNPRSRWRDVIRKQCK